MTDPVEQDAATTYGGQPERATTLFANGGVLPPGRWTDLHLDECILEVHPTYKFHATMAACKVEQPQIDQWAQVDRDWWAQHPRQAAARGTHFHLEVGGDVDPETIRAGFQRMQVSEGLG